VFCAFEKMRSIFNEEENGFVICSGYKDVDSLPYEKYTFHAVKDLLKVVKDRDWMI
jgi:hypothetical protein